MDDAATYLDQVHANPRGPRRAPTGKRRSDLDGAPDGFGGCPMCTGRLVITRDGGKITGRVWSHDSACLLRAERLTARAAAVLLGGSEFRADLGGTPRGNGNGNGEAIHPDALALMINPPTPR